MGHTYSAIFRVTPIAGDAYTVDISTYTHITTAQPTYEPVLEEKEFIDRSVGITPRGWRCSVSLEFQFPTPSSEETTLATTVLDLAMEDLAKIELSLDGGTTYREVVLTDFRQEALSGKNIGLLQQTTWICKDLLTTKPAIVSGSW